MHLIVLDAHVLADAFEGDRFSARLLTWLAYGKVSHAIDEIAQEELLLASVPGARQGGPSRNRSHEAAEEQWTRLDDELDGLPNDWGLVTSRAVLREMSDHLSRRRHHTRINPYRATTLVRNVAAEFASNESIQRVRRDADSPPTPLVAIALAQDAEYVVSNPRERTAFSRFTSGMLEHLDHLPRVGETAHQAVERLAARIPRLDLTPDERAGRCYGRFVLPHTRDEFRRLPEVPDLGALDGTLKLLHELFMPVTSAH